MLDLHSSARNQEAAVLFDITRVEITMETGLGENQGKCTKAEEQLLIALFLTFMSACTHVIYSWLSSYCSRPMWSCYGNKDTVLIILNLTDRCQRLREDTHTHKEWQSMTNTCD